MKKRIEIISILLIVVISTISVILLTKKDDKSINLDNDIAYMYEDGTGNYVPGSSNAWSTGEYVLDIEDSSCNGDEDPLDLIDWDPSSNGVLLKANENISCTLYFNIKSEQEKFFQSLLGKSGKGELLYHNSQLENGANDHGYRFSGNDPNNFICFGPGSESYTSSSGQCPDGNLYRIIGYVPVTLSGGQTEFRIKVIKSEYATKEDLEKDTVNGTEYFDGVYENLKRVKAETGVDSFHWHDDYDSEHANVWGSSSLYQALNSTSNSYLHKLNGWADKVETVQWNVAGHDTSEVTAKSMYDIENNKQYGASTQVSAKIGLMYPSDYGFASEPKSWEYILYMYDDNSDDNHDNNDKNQNRENNWLFNGVYEWTISHNSGNTGYAFYVCGSGYVGDDADIGTGSGYSVRPVFYLNSNVTLSGGDGSYENPYKVS